MALPAGTKKNSNQIRIAGQLGGYGKSFSRLVFVTHFLNEHSVHLKVGIREEIESMKL
jgi:hypothetical protein